MSSEGPLTAPLPRRRFLSGGAGLAAGAALLAAGCGGASKPSHGGTLRTGTALPLATGLDPQTETATGLAIVPRIYGYLWHVDSRDDTVALDHAASFEQPDDTTTIVHLRDGLRFHDAPPAGGRVLTAEDVAFSILRFRDNPLVSSKLWHTSVLDAAEATDRTTLRVTTRRPYVYSLQALGDISAGAIIPREVGDGDGFDITHAGAGSGPFLIESVDTDGEVRLARNPSYHVTGLPYLDAMVWQIFADDVTKLQALRDRLVDVAPNRDKPEADGLREGSDDIEVARVPALAYVSLGLRADRPPLADPRVREALDLAIDRPALIRDVTFGDGQVLGPVNPHLARGFWSLPRSDVVAASGGPRAEERLARARELLDAAGASGAELTLQAADEPPVLDVANVLVDQLRSLGLGVKLERLSLLAWFSRLRAGDFQAAVISHQPYETPDLPLRFYHSAGPFARTSPFGFRDAEIDALVERSWGERARAARRHTLREAQALMLAARPMLQLFTSVGYTSAWKYVRDRMPELPGSLAYVNHALWLDR